MDLLPPLWCKPWGGPQAYRAHGAPSSCACSCAPRPTAAWWALADMCLWQHGMRWWSCLPGWRWCWWLWQ